MPVGPQRSPYPKSEEEVAGSRWEAVHRIHGAGDTQALFKGAPKTITPWPSAGRTKDNPLGYNPERVSQAMTNPSAHMRDLDPRDLHATQPWVTQEGTNYYMGSEYHSTGRTFRDMEQSTNRFPIVYTDSQGRNQILSGHHRATAALLNGKQLRAIHIEE